MPFPGEKAFCCISIAPLTKHSSRQLFSSEYIPIVVISQSTGNNGAKFKFKKQCSQFDIEDAITLYLA